jgi:hypothetical protein
VSAPTPLLELFRRGEVAREVRLLAARGSLAPRAHEQLAILVHLLTDTDEEVRTLAAGTLDRVPLDGLKACLARTDVGTDIREFFAARGVEPGDAPASSGDDPLVEAEPNEQPEPADAAAQAQSEEQRRDSITQHLARMSFTERLKAAAKGSREMRAILVRDPNKLIAATVLSSPKLTQAEIESYARMANVAEDVLRIIGSNRTWMKNYGVVVGLTRNPKTPLGMSLNLMPRLNDRDLQALSMDRNVPEALRVAARKKLTAGTSR